MMADSIQINKRIRKSTDVFVPPDSLKTPKKRVILPGIGTKLEDIPNVVSNFEEITWSSPHLKMLHSIIFGIGKKKEFKSNLLQFSGLSYMNETVGAKDKDEIVEDPKADDEEEENEGERKVKGEEKDIPNDKEDHKGENAEGDKEDKVDDKKDEAEGDKEDKEEGEKEDKAEGDEENKEVKAENDKEVKAEDEKKEGKEGDNGNDVDEEGDDQNDEGEEIQFEREKIVMKIDKLMANDLKTVMDLVDIDRDPKSFEEKKAPTKDMLIDRFLDWLEKPEESGRNKRKLKQLKGAAKGGRRSSSGSTKKRKSTTPTKSTKEKKRVGQKKKKISKENVDSGNEENTDAETVVAKKKQKKKDSTKKIKFNIPGCTIQQVRQKVKEIVEKGDKDELSVRTVRLSLEEWLDADLKKSKDIIRSIVMDAMK